MKRDFLWNKWSPLFDLPPTYEALEEALKFPTNLSMHTATEASVLNFNTVTENIKVSLH